MKNYIFYIILISTIVSCQRLSKVNGNNVASCPSSIDTSRVGSNSVDESVIITNQNLECLITKIQNDDLKKYDDVNKIPLFINQFIGLITKNDFWLANPNESWQVGCISPMEFDTINKSELIEIDDNGNQVRRVAILNKEYPRKQLVQFEIGANTAVLSYRSGGWGTMNHILLFEFHNEMVIDFWCYNPKTQNDLKGSIIGNIKSQFETNTLEKSESLKL